MLFTDKHFEASKCQATRQHFSGGDKEVSRRQVPAPWACTLVGHPQ